jgi:DNA-directed RNA polymerase III subunit RPC6
MLAHIEPSREVTGGAWYSDNELDQDMIAVCQQTALSFIQTNRFGTLEQVHSFIRQHQLLTVDLRPDEVQSVLDTLVFDGRVRAALSSWC